MSTPLSRPVLGAPTAWAAWAAGCVEALAGTLAVVLTLGLLAFAPLGRDATLVGIPAALSGVVAGGLVYALLATVAVPTAAPSSATTLVLASLVATLVADPALDLARAADRSALVAVCGLCVVAQGLVQLVMAAFGLHRLARLVPQPVLAGFMNGVALLILLAQVPPLLGLPALAHWSGRELLAQAQPLAAAVGLLTAVAVWTAAARRSRVPAALVGLAAGTAAHGLLSALLPGHPAGPLVGPMPQGLVRPDALAPLATDPAAALALRHAGAVLSTAVVLAVIGALETLLAAVAIDQMAATRHANRRELVAIALANLASGLVGGLPLVLSRARAVQLVDRRVLGRQAPLAAVACFALLFALGSPLVAALPKPVLAGIMLTIGVALVDRWTRDLVAQALAGDRSAELRASLALVALVCAVTLVFGFPAALAAGTVLSVGVFIRSLNRSLLRSRFSAAVRPSRRVYAAAQEALLGPRRGQVAVLELEGALFFGNAERLAAGIDALPPDTRAVVLDLRRVSTIDESGAVVLEQASRRLAQRGVALLLGGVTAGHAHGRRLRAFGCFRGEPRDDWFPDVDLAIEAAERRLLAEAGLSAPQGAVPLRQTALLRGLDEARAARLEAALLRRPLAAGEVLFREGDPGDGLYVLVQGSISIVGAAGHRYVSFFPSMIFGETAMLDGRGRSAGAVADVDSVVMCLTAAELDRLGTEDPGLAAQLMRNLALHLSERLRAASAAWQASAE